MPAQGHLCVVERLAIDILSVLLEDLRGTLGTLFRLAFDQLINAPICIFGFFWAFAATDLTAAVLKGSLGAGLMANIGHATWVKIKADYWTTVISNWKVWIAPQLINFAVMPVPLRVPFANVVAVVWNVILSIIANR